MEQNLTEEEKQINSIYEYASQLLFEQEKTYLEVKQELIRKGLDEKSANIVVKNIEKEVDAGKRKQANNNMLYGLLWCVGGIIATLAEIGFIFWGAVIFGGFQFLKGVIDPIRFKSKL